MRMEKKRILKEDGRYLVYYHFPDTAPHSEAAAFAAIDAVGAEAERLPMTTPTTSTTKNSEEQPDV